jgi:hypothetical protein
MRKKNKAYGKMARTLVIAASAFLVQLGQAQPTVLTQPQSQTADASVTVTLSVQVLTESTPTLPTVNSGTLQLWLAADTGVVPDGSGLVSDWPDLSGNGNDAVQTDSSLEPSLVNPAPIGGRAALRFNGIQNNINGSYMFGSGAVALPNALTIFTLYDAISTTNAENAIWDIGAIGQTGENRGDDISGGDLRFTFWGHDYSVPFVVPTNTYRIRIDRLDTNMDTLNVFDVTAASSTNFTLSVSGAYTVGFGYYIGGLNSSLEFVGTSRNFDGDIAEFICYQGYLSEPDRLAVQAYLEEKYYQVGDPDVTYQWQLNTTNIAGATNATLILTNIQAANAGTYTVTAFDANGSTSSSPAVLTILYPPSISVQPASQSTLPGSNVTFTVSANGNAPLSYQWMFEGEALAGDTNAVLSLTNVQAATEGLYSVLVSNSIGSITSSNAVLQIIFPPTIAVQPISQAANSGSNITLTVALSVPVSPTLPAVTSGSLALWLKADAGVVANSAGLVSQWQDQSGKTNNASQTNATLQPLLVYPPANGGRPAVQFNGIQQSTVGNYLQCTNSVHLSNALTAFTVYMLSATSNAEDVMWVIGSPGQAGECRGEQIYTNQIGFTLWSHDYPSGFAIPTNSFHVCIDQLNTNMTSLQISDVTATTASNIVLTTSGAVTPLAGFCVGGYNPAQTAGRNFPGDIAEVIIFQGALTAADVTAVNNYLQQKYFFSNPANIASFQWTFDGTNISGATNAAFSIASVQTSNAGTYSVVVSNAAGSAISSNAVLVVGYSPTISVQPQSRSVGLGNSVTFSVLVGGNAPLSYQWQFDSAKINNATNSSLTLAGIQGTNGGSYAVVVTNLYGSITSSNAVLTVVTSAVQVVSSTANGSTAALVPVQLISAGNENSIDFSLDYSNSVLTYTGATLGSNATGAFLIPITSQTNSGHLGLELELPANTTFSLGTQQVVVISFAVAPLTNAVVTTVTFGSQPTVEDVFNSQFTLLPATYSNGNVFLAATAVAGDASPRPNGDGVVLLNDWFQEGRFVAGLDTFSNASEFQRADCAPRTTSGDGLITVADWVQVGRYAAGFDPPTLVSNRTATGAISNTPSASRILSLVPVTQGQSTNTVNLQLAAQGTENGLSCSLTFDATSLAFLCATVGAGAEGAMLEINTNQVAAGNLGLAIALLPGSAIPLGTQPIVQLSFVSISYSNTLNLSFGDIPVVRQVADTNATVMPVSFQNGSLAVAGLSWPLLSVSQNGTNILLSWPTSASGFTVQSTISLGQTWASLAGTPVTNGNNVVLTTSVSTNAEFFRLQH